MGTGTSWTRTCAAALFLGLVACSHDQPRGPARRVILVTCDTLRADRLGCYGYARPTSPHVDAFARDAVVFDDAWSTAPWTGPSLSALMTGRLPDELGVPGGNRFPLPAAARTIAEDARDAGCSTGAVVSNWILRRPPETFGDAGVAQGFDHFDDRMEVRERNRESYERRASDTTDDAIRWLDEERRAGRDRVFAWIHYQDPHGPYDPPPEFLARVKRDPTSEAPLPVGTTVKGRGQIPSYQVVGDERAPEQYRERYDGEIASFDEHFGRLVAWLKQSGWYDDSLIVFSADHGESLGEGGYWFCHGENVRPEVVRVPLIVRFPAGSRHVAGTARDGYERVDRLASHLDLWPTFRAALGLAPVPNRGRSLFGDALPEDRLFTQTMGRVGAPNRWTACLDEHWRLVVEKDGAPRLFARLGDPLEAQDVAAQHPDVVKALRERERRFLDSASGPALEERALEPGAEVDRGLEKLGYTGGDH